MAETRLSPLFHAVRFLLQHRILSAYCCWMRRVQSNSPIPVVPVSVDEFLSTSCRDEGQSIFKALYRGCSPLRIPIISHQEIEYGPTGLDVESLREATSTHFLVGPFSGRRLAIFKAKTRESLIRDIRDVSGTPTLTEKGCMRVFQCRRHMMTTDHFASPHQSPE